MAWNEPGGNDNDPWGNRKNSGGPPDLDEVFKNLKNRAEGLFGRRSQNNRSGGGFGGGSSGGFTLKHFGWLALVGLLLWGFSGFFILQPAERGVITQFGKYKTTESSGLHWHIPWPVQQLERLDVEQIRSVQLRDQPVLTQDENIVDIDMAVQYKICLLYTSPSPRDS